MEKIRVGIMGAVSYTGRELVGLLLRHNLIEIAWLTSESCKNQEYCEIYPKFAGKLSKPISTLIPAEDIKKSDVNVVFSCLPHGVSAQNLQTFLYDNKVRIVDFSADFRIKNLTVFENTYCVKHPSPNRISDSVYGLPELFESEIRRTSLVANPGCYPTSILLPLIPLLKNGKIKTEGIIADSKSGVSGAGKKPTDTTHFVNCNESVSAYKIGNAHRHLPEIQEQLGLAGGKEADIIFTPHLMPMERGILSTIYCEMTSNGNEDIVRETLSETYRNAPFVHIVDKPPSTGDVKGTNNCHIFIQSITGSRRLIIVSVIDNLLKGASGQAVQNMNVMFGLDQTAGLI